MKRKTNLFYYDNNDSNFLTFSNYTEHLTGNFLATDYKLFPSRFLCLYIPRLESEGKEEFITKYLTGYYENKLAFLRDNINIPDTKLLYLNYLLEAILKFDSSTDLSNVYFSEIVEQNYNGTFTDIICTINSISDKIASIEQSGIIYKKINYEHSLTYLYGWYNKTIEGVEEYNGPKNLYETTSPIFDEIDIKTDTLKDYQYHIDSSINKIKFIYTDKSSIKFNILIPLYDINNMNTVTNKVTLDFLNEIDLSVPEINDCVTNVPYGIWFAPKTIELEMDNTTNYSPSWSLLIGTQFKPFPASNHLQQDISNQETSKAFQTFSQLLSLQNNISNEILKFNSQLSDITNRLNKIENNINMICDVTEVNKLKEELQSVIDNFKNMNNGNGESSTPVLSINKWIYKQ